MKNEQHLHQLVFTHGMRCWIDSKKNYEAELYFVNNMSEFYFPINRRTNRYATSFDPLKKQPQNTLYNIGKKNTHSCTDLG